jgi:hypothetical protein
MEIFLNERFVFSVLGPVIGLFVGVVSAWCWRHIQEQRGWLTGEWTQSIGSFGGRSAREDRVVCRHRGERIGATITRMVPEEDPPKNWIFEGALRQDGSLVGFFLGARANADSYGVIFMRKKDHNSFSGHYQKLLNQRDFANQTTSTEILRREQISLTWTRVVRRGLGSYLKGLLRPPS